MTESNSSDASGRSVRLTWEFSFAAILQGVQVVALLSALVYWFVVNAQRGADNERRLAELQSNVSQQIGEVRQTITVGLTDMRQQLNSLPDTRARLDQAERRLIDMDSRLAGFEARITGMERQAIELRSDMNAITRASNVPLAGGADEPPPRAAIAAIFAALNPHDVRARIVREDFGPNTVSFAHAGRSAGILPCRRVVSQAAGASADR
jgi:TolA-binding protein